MDDNDGDGRNSPDTDSSSDDEDRLKELITQTQTAVRSHAFSGA